MSTSRAAIFFRPSTSPASRMLARRLVFLPPTRGVPPNSLSPLGLLLRVLHPRDDPSCAELAVAEHPLRGRRPGWSDRGCCGRRRREASGIRRRSRPATSLRKSRISRAAWRSARGGSSRPSPTWPSARPSCRSRSGSSASIAARASGPSGSFSAITARNFGENAGPRPGLQQSNLNALRGGVALRLRRLVGGLELIAVRLHGVVVRLFERGERPVVVGSAVEFRVAGPRWARRPRRR